jgi:hypothetical protein
MYSSGIKSVGTGMGFAITSTSNRIHGVNSMKIKLSIIPLIILGFVSFPPFFSFFLLFSVALTQALCGFHFRRKLAIALSSGHLSGSSGQ